MSIENPTSKEPVLNEQGKEALQDLKLTLEAQKIPDEDRQGYIDRLVSKIDGVTDEDMIDMVLGNILLETTKRAKLIKSQKEATPNKEQDSKQEGSCPKCGAPTGPGHNFCGKCGNKLK